MEKQNENNFNIPPQDDEPFPELTQEQIDRIVNRQLRKLDAEYEECIRAPDINAHLVVEESAINWKENPEEEEEESEHSEEGNEDQYAKIGSDEENEEEDEDKDDVSKGSAPEQINSSPFAKREGFKREVKEIPKEKAEEMRKFISAIDIKPPSWAKNLSDDQFKKWVSKMLPSEK